MILLISSMLTACIGPGLLDYSIELPGNFHLVRLSADVVRIEPKNNFEFDFKRKQELSIPAKVVEIAFDDQYVLAKRHALVKDLPKLSDISYEMPDKMITIYYILDTFALELHEVSDLEEFNRLRDELNIPENLRLDDPINYK